MLSRVLITNKIFEVDQKSEITKELLQVISQQDFDSIHIKSTDEYLILNPNHVLPEFMMHLNVIPQESSSTSLSNSQSNVGVIATGRNWKREANLQYPHISLDVTRYQFATSASAISSSPKMKLSPSASSSSILSPKSHFTSSYAASVSAAPTPSYDLRHWKQELNRYLNTVNGRSIAMFTEMEGGLNEMNGNEGNDNKHIIHAKQKLIRSVEDMVINCRKELIEKYQIQFQNIQNLQTSI